MAFDVTIFWTYGVWCENILKMWRVSVPSSVFECVELRILVCRTPYLACQTPTLRLFRPQLYVYFDFNFTSISTSTLRLVRPQLYVYFDLNCMSTSPSTLHLFRPQLYLYFALNFTSISTSTLRLIEKWRRQVGKIWKVLRNRIYSPIQIFWGAGGGVRQIYLI